MQRFSMLAFAGWFAFAIMLMVGPVAAQDQPRLTLEEAIRLAVTNSPSLQVARGALEEAAGGVKEAGGPRYPSLSADGSVFQYQDPMIVYPLHELDLTARPVFDRTLFQGSLSLGYTLFDGGIRGGRLNQARALESAATDQVRGSEQAVLANTVRAFADVLTARTVEDAQAQRLRALQAETERVRRFLAEGRAARVEQLRAEAALSQARADHATAAARLSLAEATLARLLGVDPSRTRADGLVRVQLLRATPDFRDSLLAQARRASPHLLAASGRMAAAQAAKRAASATWYPTLRLEGRLVTYAGGSATAQAEWQGGARLSYPIFTGGSRTGAVQRADAVFLEAEASYREVDLAIAARLDQVLVAMTEARERVEALHAAVAQWTEVVRTEALALDQGAGTQTDYLRAEADLAIGRAALAQSQAAELVSHVDLAQVLGALSLESLQTIVEKTR